MAVNRVICIIGNDQNRQDHIYLNHIASTILLACQLAFSLYKENVLALVFMAR